MRIRISGFIALIIVIVGCAGIFVMYTALPLYVSGSSRKPTLPASTTPIWTAVALAESAVFEQKQYRPEDYMVTSAQQLVIKGKYTWRITFKPVALLPEDPAKGIIGLGGEIFVNVDLETKNTEILYGE